MDNYRRPSPVQPGERQAVDGFIPTETKTADPKLQPYRRAVIKESETPVQAAPRRYVAPIDMSLPEGESFSRHHLNPVVKRRMHTLRVLMLRTALAMMILIVGVGGLLVSEGYIKLHKVFKGTAVRAAALQANVDPSLLKGEGDGRINVLLVGIGGAGHDGADLTDTLMLASIDPVNNTATLLSVPRDLWVTLPGHGSMKINAAYETGKYGYLHKITSDNSNSKAIQAGFTSIDQTMETVLGVPIDYNLLLDFQGFRQAIDTVGGITVNVPSDLYDPTMAWENGGDPYLARAGTQTFDGKHALIYVRSRETSSDFARAQRQRAVLLALKQKAVTLGVIANPAKLSGLMSAFGNNVQTDLSISDASRLYSIFKKIGNSKINSISLAGDTTTTSAAAGADSLVTTGNLNGQSIVMPKAGLDNYGAIQNYVHSQLKDGYILKEHAKVLVVDGAGQTAAGQAEATTLKSYGYDVVGVDDEASSYTSTKVVDLSHGKDKYTKHYLEQRFNTTAITKLPDSNIQPGNADFVVVLGGDETSSN